MCTQRKRVSIFKDSLTFKTLLREGLWMNFFLIGHTFILCSFIAFYTVVLCLIESKFLPAFYSLLLALFCLGLYRFCYKLALKLSNFTSYREFWNIKK